MYKVYEVHKPSNFVVTVYADCGCTALSAEKFVTNMNLNIETMHHINIDSISNVPEAISTKFCRIISFYCYYQLVQKLRSDSKVIITHPCTIAKLFFSAIEQLNKIFLYPALNAFLFSFSCQNQGEFLFRDRSAFIFAWSLIISSN